MTTILTGTDFSPAADAALVHAIELARHESAELVIAHVRADRSRIDKTLRAFYDRDDATTEGDEIARLLEMRCESARTTDIAARAAVLAGDAAEALTDHAAEIGADYLVVGSLGTTGLERFLIGSTAERCVRLTPCRLIIARGPGAPAGYRSILAATDFSAPADAALDAATELVATDGSIELFNAITPPSLISTGFGGGPVSPALGGRLRASVERACEARIDRHRSAPARLSHSAAFGPRARAILDKLDEGSFDLVALGTESRAGARRVLLGGVAEKVIRHAPCSALVVPERAADSGRAG